MALYYSQWLKSIHLYHLAFLGVFPFPKSKTPKLSNKQDKNTSVYALSVLLTFSYYTGRMLKLDSMCRFCSCEGKGVCRTEKIRIFVQITQLGRGHCDYGNLLPYLLLGVLFPGAPKSSFVHFNNLSNSYLWCPHSHTRETLQTQRPDTIC